uniref:Uncharacterized protein n=1 Tax=Lepeophtheirus salmonis TaxID=72036 RepID=A0A0K2TMS0_LEPSM
MIIILMVFKHKKEDIEVEELVEHHRLEQQEQQEHLQ